MRRDLVIVLVIFSVLPIMIDFAYAQDNEKIREKAIKINSLAYECIKYINRYVLKKKKKRKGK